ncbi:hypothetical protein ACF1BS_01250 [Streptomyces sp. NPDC014748]|uniref:hypothetical protein n=1 Tax=Streptomyces sp. NPDC014748 TaxID=3364905 RepID=UPI0036F9B344
MPKKRNPSRRRKSRISKPASQHWSLPPKDAIKGGTPEARNLLADALMDNKMACRATYLSDPVFGTAPFAQSDEEDIPVLLFEPAKIVAVKDTRTGTVHEMRTERLVMGGFDRLSGGFWRLKVIEGWGISRTSTSVLLRDPEGDVAVEGDLALDERWVSDVARYGYAIVLQGAPLGVRLPPGRSVDDYSDHERALEFKRARSNGILAGGIVKWTGNNRDALKWVLFPAGVFGIPFPVAYMPLWNLEVHGGPEAFGFERLDSDSIGARATGMVAELTDSDLDLMRPTESDPQISFIAGYRDNSAGSIDSQFAKWRISALKSGGIVVIAGPREMPSVIGAGSGNNELAWKAVRDSWGALVPLGAGCLEQSIELQNADEGSTLDPLAGSIALSKEQAEYAETLKRKMESLESFKIHVSYDLERLIDRDSIFRWITNMWPVACQTCGDPLGVTVDICADGPLADEKVLLSMHHSSCRASGVTPDGGVSMKCATSSYAVGNLGDADPLKRSRKDIPVMVVNPSCEQLLLQRADASTWVNGVLEPFKQLGFIAGGKTPPPLVEEVEALLSDEYLIVRVSKDFLDHLPEQEWVIEAPEHVITQIRRFGGLVVSLVTKALPTRLGYADIPSACGDPEALIGWVPLKKEESL